MDEQTIKNKIEEVLKEIRPALLRDGGDAELIDFKDGVASIKMKGACQGCPYAPLTFESLIEQELKSKISEIKEVRKAE